MPAGGARGARGPRGARGALGALWSAAVVLGGAAALPRVADLGGAAGEWTVEQRPTNGSLGALPARVPGQVHLDLQAARVLPDLYSGYEDWGQAWVGESAWTYRRRLDAPGCLQVGGTGRDREGCGVTLEFDGVDTVATVSLNGQPVLECCNQFRRYSVRLDGLLRGQGSDELEVSIRSPFLEAEALNEAYPVHTMRDEHPGYWPHITHPQHVRKDQSNFGWDWGPAAVTAGIWRPVRLVTFARARLGRVSAHVSGGSPSERSFQVHIRVSVEVTADSGDLRVSAVLVGAKEAHRGASNAISAPGRGPACSASPVPKDIETELTLDVPKDLVDLWWPNGMGSQPLYEVKVTLEDAASAAPTAEGDLPQVLDQAVKRVGFRHFELTEEAPPSGEAGLLMQFAVNGVKFFAKGGNLVPQDALDSRLPTGSARRLVQSAREAHHNMVRVWGGGHYQSSEFYAACDEAGLLVWQEMMFACSEYPTGHAFLENVRSEVADVVGSLSHHPSVALWSANNENQHFATTLRNPDATPRNVTAYHELYLVTVRQALAKADPWRPFWPSSPSNGMLADDIERGIHIQRWGDEYDERIGDIHFYDYDSLCVAQAGIPNPRFASEYGWQSWPSLATWQPALDGSPAKDLAPFSDFMRHRQHHPNGTEQVLGMMSRVLGNYSYDSQRPEGSFDDFVYLSQVLQSHCMGASTANFRRKRSTPGAYTSGALYWQLNDAWQAPSWATTEYGGHWKLSHYALARLFAPLALTLVRDPGGSVQAHAVVDSLLGGADSSTALLRVTAWAWDGAPLGSQPDAKVELRPHSAVLAGAWREADLLGTASPRDAFVRAQLLAADGSTLAAAHWFPMEARGGFSRVNLAEGARVRAKVVPGSGRCEGGECLIDVQVWAEGGVAVGVALEAGGWPGGPARIPGKWSDNLLEALVPGERADLTFHAWDAATAPDEAALGAALRARHLREAFPPAPSQPRPARKLLGRALDPGPPTAGIARPRPGP